MFKCPWVLITWYNITQHTLNALSTIIATIIHVMVISWLYVCDNTSFTRGGGWVWPPPPPPWSRYIDPLNMGSYRGWMLAWDTMEIDSHNHLMVLRCTCAFSNCNVNSSTLSSRSSFSSSKSNFSSSNIAWSFWNMCIKLVGDCLIGF